MKKYLIRKNQKKNENIILIFIIKFYKKYIR